MEILFVCTVYILSWCVALGSFGESNDGKPVGLDAIIGIIFFGLFFVAIGIGATLENLDKKKDQV